MPTNTLGTYDPIFYAQEGLAHLEKALGMASRVHRGYDRERRSFRKGSVIEIRKPSTFVAQNAPSTPQNLDTETLQITLDQWKEVKFALTDKELTYTGEEIIEEHIRPAAYALADEVDSQLVLLARDIPWFYDLNSTTSVKDVTHVRKVMRNNAVPLNDPSMIHYMVDGDLEAEFLALTAFSQHQGAGDDAVQTQRRGSLGIKFGSEVFANQNVASHTKGTASTGALAINGTFAKGATTVNLDAVSVTGTLVPGDTFVIAGNTQRYAVTNTVTAATNAFTGVNITPGLAAAPADDAVVTVSLDDHVMNLMFHRNAFAFASAPLNDKAKELGAQVATVQDPVTGLALRARLYYDGDESEVNVALDILFGKKLLDANMAVRGRG